jgi:hypothetical protein
VSEVINEAAEMLVPILSAGAGAAARDTAERAGAHVSEALTRILARVRPRLSGGRPGLRDIEAALRASIDAGQLTRQDLQMVVDHRQSIQAKNVFTGTTIIKGDFHA